MKFASFRVNLMITICLICLVIALLVGSLWMYTAQERLKNDVHDMVLDDSHLVARDVQAYSEKAVLATDIAARSPGLIDAVGKSDKDAIQPIADHLGASLPGADFVQVADADGSVLYSTGPTDVSNLHSYSWYGVTRKEQPTITDSYYNAASGTDKFAVMSPVKDGGRLIGYIVAGLSPEALTKVTAVSSGRGPDNTIVVDSSGRVVSHDPGTSLDTRTNVSAYTPVKMALQGHDGVERHTDAWDGQERVSAYSTVPGTGWGVIVSRPVSAADGTARNLMAVVGGTLGFLVIGFTAFGYYASRNLSEPITELSKKAKKIATGGYDTRIDVQRDDELGDIARSINDMKAELRLKESLATDVDQQFHLLLRELPFGVLITGADGEYVESNAALLDLFGVTEDELAGMSIFNDDWVLWDFFKADGKAMPREANPILLAYATRRPVRDVATRIYRSTTGDTAWLRISAEPHLDIDGRVKRVICTFADYTVRQLLEESLKLARFSIDKSPDEIIWITSEGRLHGVNDAVCDRLGYPRDRLLSMDIWDVDTGFTQDDWAMRWNELKGLGYASFRSEYRASNGTVYPADVSMHYVEHDGNEYVIAFVRDIGELKQVEDSLAIVEADLTRVFETGKISTWQWDRQRDQFTWSDGAHSILGTAPGESPGSYDEYLRIVHPGDRKAVETVVRDAIASGNHFRIDHRLVQAGGTISYVHAEGEVVRDDTGEAVRILGAIQDVTALRLVEISRNELQRQMEFEHARLEAVLRNMPAGMVIAEAPSGRILMANHQMGEIFRDKFPLSSGIGSYGEWGVFQSHGRLYDPEEIPLARSIRKGEVVRGEEIEFLRGDGTWGLISINSAPIYDKEGHMIDAIATFFDITESKQAENALKDSESNLAKAQRIAHLGNWVWNIQSNEMRYSDEMRQIYGIARDGLVATFDDFMKSVYPDDRGSVRRSINASLNRREPHSIDFRIARSDGAERTVHSEGEVVFDETGKPIRMFGIVQDVSERRQAEDALREAKMQAELYLDLMSHDINNMNMIGMGYLELAQSRLKLGPEDRELLSKPEEVLRNSSVLINNVRKTRKAITGQLDLGPVDAGSIIDELIERYCDTEGVTIVSGGAQLSGAYVMANDLLKDVFSNLLDNAVKHTVKPVIVGIGITRLDEGDRKYYRIYVEDSGPGIPDGQKDRVFERMGRGETPARGTGLGLYLVRTLVESYHGRVWVENRVPDDHRKGSRFVVQVPAA